MSVTKVAEKVGEAVCCPFFDANGSLHIVDASSGSILALHESSGNCSQVCNTGGAPSSASLSPDEVIHVADIGHKAIITVIGGEQKTVVDSHRLFGDDVCFKGPSALAFSPNGDIFFTDSGPLGETDLQNPAGSLYSITSREGEMHLRPILYECLAHPCGVATSPDGNCIYTCEMARNRILRTFQKPAGVFHTAVFHQFSGCVGPSSVAVGRDGTLYVSTYEPKEMSSEGVVYVITSRGRVVKEISLPEPELTGVALSPDDSTLMVTDGKSGTVFSVTLDK